MAKNKLIKTTGGLFGRKKYLFTKKEIKTAQRIEAKTFLGDLSDDFFKLQRIKEKGHKRYKQSKHSTNALSKK